MLLDDDTLPRTLAEDWRTAPIAAPDRAMLAFAVKLTRTPGDMTSEDARALRDAGFGDTAILDITQVTAYYGYVNRLADGLGVELEEWWTPETLTLSREAFEARRARRRAGGGADPAPS